MAGDQSSNNKVTPSSKMSLSRSMWWLWGCHLSQVSYLRGLTYRAASGPQTAPSPQGRPTQGALCSGELYWPWRSEAWSAVSQEVVLQHQGCREGLSLALSLQAQAPASVPTLLPLLLHVPQHKGCCDMCTVSFPCSQPLLKPSLLLGAPPLHLHLLWSPPPTRPLRGPCIPKLLPGGVWPRCC